MKPKPLVLLVEDDATQLQFAAAIIRSTGRFDVETPQNAEDGLKLAEQSKPDLIVSDNYLPGETGVEFCKRIKGHPFLRNTLFMLLTSENEVGHKILAVDLGADEYISKPYNPDELLTRIRALVRIGELQRELAAEGEELRWANDMLRSTIDGVTHLLARVIAIRVPNASGRADAAANLVRWMADRMHIDRKTHDQLELAARLHEIGKIGLPDDLLRKVLGDLSPAELTHMSEFALVGQRIMEGITEFEEIARWIRHQLENFDGSGYPDRLRNEEIPMPARILRAVNFMELSRLHTSATTAAFLEQIDKARNTILDPRIAQLLKEYVEVNEQPSWLEGKRQVTVLELREGMVIASDIVTGSGTKLLPREMRITEQQIDRILAQHHHDPIVNSIYVYDRT